MIFLDPMSQADIQNYIAVQDHKLAIVILCIIFLTVGTILCMEGFNSDSIGKRYNENDKQYNRRMLNLGIMRYLGVTCLSIQLFKILVFLFLD